MWRVNYKSKNRHIYLYVELFFPNQTERLSNSKVIKVSKSHRVGDNTSDMRVGTMRIVTVCYRLVAHRALPRHVPVARHFKLVVPGVRADDLANPADFLAEPKPLSVNYENYKLLSLVLLS